MKVRLFALAFTQADGNRLFRPRRIDIPTADKPFLMKNNIVINNLLVNFYKLSKETGRAGNLSLLFLHGWRSSAEVWRAIAKALESENVELYALDFPGFGESPKPPRDFTLQDYTDLVAGFIQKLELKSVVLIGHSFGGRVAIKLAATKPSLVAKLVLIDSAGLVLNPNKKRMMNMIAKAAKPFFKPSFMQKFRKTIYQTIGAEDYMATPDLRGTFINVVNEDLSEYLGQIRQETLIIWGEKDTDTPLEFAQIMKDKIKHSRLVIFEGAGHFSFLDRPKEFAGELKKFIAEGKTN